MDEIIFDSYTRIEHVITGYWLHALKGQPWNTKRRFVIMKYKFIQLNTSKEVKIISGQLFFSTALTFCYENWQALRTKQEEFLEGLVFGCFPLYTTSYMLSYSSTFWSLITAMRLCYVWNRNPLKRQCRPFKNYYNRITMERGSNPLSLR